MLPLVWRTEARADLAEIITYIAQRNLPAADRLAAAIEHVTEQLPAHPYIHRPGRIAGTREAVVHPNYIVVYKVAAAIEVLAELHARQSYPRVGASISSTKSLASFSPSPVASRTCLIAMILLPCAR